MRRMILAAMIALATCSASSVQSFVQVGSRFCSDQDSQQSSLTVTVSAACQGARLIPQTSFTGSAFATATLSPFDLRYGVSADLLLLGGVGGDAAELIATASSQDRLTIPYAPPLRLSYLVDGSFSFKNLPGVNVDVEATFSITCNGNVDRQNVTNGGFYIFTCPFVPNQPFDLFSAFDLRATLSAGATPPFDEHVTADYSHTVRLAGVTLLNAGGPPIQNPTIIAESGFDYANATVAPEPGSLALVLTGACLVAAGKMLRRRTRRTHALQPYARLPRARYRGAQ